MLRAYKYRLNLNNEQKTFINKSFGCGRVVYNYCLQRRIELYKDGKQKISAFDLCKEIVQLKKTEGYYWLSEVDHQSLCCSVMNMDNAYKHFFNRGFGFPKFKCKYFRQSCKFTQGIKIDFSANKVRFPKIGWVRAYIDREFTGTIKTTTVTKNASGKYYVSILVENGMELPAKPAVHPQTTIGIDVGVKNIVTFSDGTTIANPRNFFKYEERLALLQQRLSRRDKNRYPDEKDKSSRRRRKAQMAVAKMHQKIQNTRSNLLQKITSKIISENQTIIIEDLNIKGMTATCKPKPNEDNTGFLPNGQAAKSGLNKSILDVGLGKFFDMLEYKAEWHGKNLIKIGRFEPSSKLCSNCKHKNADLKLKDRVWTCVNCGTEHDRDVNAAVNIKEIGLKQYYLQTKSGQGMPVADV